MSAAERAAALTDEEIAACLGVADNTEERCLHDTETRGEHDACGLLRGHRGDCTGAIAVLEEWTDRRSRARDARIAELEKDLAEEHRGHIATLEVNDALRTALEEAKRWMGDPEDPTGNADAAADRFYRATGLMAPFKDQAQAMGGDDEKERRDAWKAWAGQERKRVWTLVTAALRGES